MEKQGDENFLLLVITVLSYIPLIWFFLAQAAKRCHDRGDSGWYQLIPFYKLWLIFADGEIGPNEYCSNPKGIGNFDEINEIGLKETF